jgi:hypothetical protein
MGILIRCSERAIAMIWLKRTFQYDGYGPYMDMLEKLQSASGMLYSEFIMVSTKRREPAASDYFIGVPTAAYAGVFDGFERISESDLPKTIDALQIADATEKPFTSRFKFAHDAPV